MEMQDMTLKEFAALTSSDAPAPGGGSISALAGALSAALAGMVAALTLGKKGYEAAQSEMEAVLERSNELRDGLLLAVEKDAASFNGFMDAMALPKGTEQEKQLRKEKMQEALKEAALTPLNTAELSAKVFPLARIAVLSGNKNAVTDALTAAMLARTAVLGALLNVRINLASIKDEGFCRETEARCGALKKLALEQEQEILDLIPSLQ